MKFSVHYFYFAVPGMEDGPDERDLGYVEAPNAATALQIVAVREVPAPTPYAVEFTDRDFFRGCLTAVDENGIKTHGRMAWNDGLLA